MQNQEKKVALSPKKSTPYFDRPGKGLYMYTCPPKPCQATVYALIEKHMHFDENRDLFPTTLPSVCRGLWVGYLLESGNPR